MGRVLRGGGAVTAALIELGTALPFVALVVLLGLLFDRMKDDNE